MYHLQSRIQSKTLMSLSNRQCGVGTSMASPSRITVTVPDQSVCCSESWKKLPEAPLITSVTMSGVAKISDDLACPRTKIPFDSLDQSYSPRGNVDIFLLTLLIASFFVRFMGL